MAAYTLPTMTFGSRLLDIPNKLLDSIDSYLTRHTDLMTLRLVSQDERPLVPLCMPQELSKTRALLRHVRLRRSGQWIRIPSRLPYACGR